MTSTRHSTKLMNIPTKEKQMDAIDTLDRGHEVHLETRHRQQDIAGDGGSEDKSLELEGRYKIFQESLSRYSLEDIEILTSQSHTPTPTIQSPSTVAHGRSFLTIVKPPGTEATAKSDTPAAAAAARQTEKSAPPRQGPAAVQQANQQKLTPNARPPPRPQAVAGERPPSAAGERAQAGAGERTQQGTIQRPPHAVGQQQQQQQQPPPAAGARPRPQQNQPPRPQSATEQRPPPAQSQQTKAPPKQALQPVPLPPPIPAPVPPAAVAPAQPASPPPPPSAAPPGAPPAGIPAAPSGPTQAHAPAQAPASQQPLPSPPPPPAAPVPTSQSRGVAQPPLLSKAPGDSQSNQPTMALSSGFMATSIASLTEPSHSAERQPETAPMAVSPPRKLSRGAEAGIVIGSISLVILILGAIMFYYYRRKPSRNNIFTSRNKSLVPQRAISRPFMQTISSTNMVPETTPPVPASSMTQSPYPEPDRPLPAVPKRRSTMSANEGSYMRLP